MIRIIQWGTAVGLLGLFVAVYLMASTSAEEIRTLPTQKHGLPSVLETIGDKTDQLNDESVLQQVAQVDNHEIAQVDRAAAQQTAGESSGHFKEMYESYGPKNSALSVDKSAFDNASTEILDDVWDRWLNIDEGYLNRHTHWHQPDRSDVTFDNFTNALHFFPADQKFSAVTAVCKQRPHYSELLIYSEGKKWLDVNQERSNSYSVTLWDWYNTVAIKSGNETFIEHSTPKVYRWNAPVAGLLVEEILRTGTFDIYVEGNQYRASGVMMNKVQKETLKAFPNLHLRASVTIQNIDEIRDCFGAQKHIVKGQVESVELNSDVLGLMTYFEDKT
ncbi:MAG: hypothetical protein O3A05_10585 [Proteobacteria bacterium]|nr:hypothetical protein [Pseudomonadota bacterium]